MQHRRRLRYYLKMMPDWDERQQKKRDERKRKEDERRATLMLTPEGRQRIAFDDALIESLSKLTREFARDLYGDGNS
jgi:hypothetical protein